MYIGKDPTANHGSRNLEKQVVMNATRHAHGGGNIITDYFFSSFNPCKRIEEMKVDFARYNKIA